MADNSIASRSYQQNNLASRSYQQNNLVSEIPGLSAHTDPNLLNFTAGLNHEADGLFGDVIPRP